MWDDKLKPWVLYGIIGGGGVIIALLVILVMKVNWNLAPDNSAVMLPLILIVGVVVLLSVLGLLTFVFSTLGLSNQNEALGLPSGSVRAVIALMLLLVFAIMAIFLYSSIAIGNTDKDSVDVAKQLITLLGTLVTAVSSFYFGANVVAAAKKETAVQPSSPPKPAKLIPDSLERKDAVQDLKIVGENLAGVTGVKLVKDGVTIRADFKAAGATQVNSEVKIDSTSAAGPWDVVVSDGVNEVKVPVPLKVM